MMMRPAIFRAVRSATASRCQFSDSGSSAIDKLRAILEEYRQSNYRQTIPTRFVKEVLEAADENKDGVISVSEIEKFLSNIGAADQLSTTEIHHVFAHLGIDEQSSIGIPLQKVKDMLIQTTK